MWPSYRIEDVIDRDADGEDGRRQMAAHGTRRSVVAVTGKQPLLDAMLVGLVAVAAASTPLVVVDRRRPR